jgi:hypothetical protein
MRLTEMAERDFKKSPLIFVITMLVGASLSVVQIYIGVISGPFVFLAIVVLPSPFLFLLILIWPKLWMGKLRIYLITAGVLSALGVAYLYGYMYLHSN